MIPTGSRVRVRKPKRPGHLRLPNYVVEKCGIVVCCYSIYPCAEDIAEMRPPRSQRLYAVAFDVETLWGNSSVDSVVVDLYEHWLERDDSSKVEL
ncbi:SH3-like domain-containing protein [Natronocella acetinitrilica]|uniref:SH3-like domain-containing protein n=1 Tax=Natronocella acetinitrilica TaxID=414046 RepID=UPI00344D936F